MADEKKVSEQEQKASAKDVFAAGMRSGYVAAYAQLEQYLISTYGNKIFGIKDVEKLLKKPEKELKKILDEQVKLGTFLASINQLRIAATGIDASSVAANVKADPKPDGKLDSGVILA